MHLSPSRVWLAFCVLLTAVLIAAAVSLLTIAPERIGRRTWKKHYTLYIENSDTIQELVIQIAERFPGVVSRYTTDVRFNTFAGFASVPIHRLPGRLDPLDPRFDPYMRRVDLLFSLESGESWEVIYLRSETNLLSTYLNLRALFKGRSIRWRLIEFDPPQSAVRVLLLLLYLLVASLLGSSGSVRAAIVSTSLPWLVLTAMSDFSVLLAFFLMAPAWVHLFEMLYARWSDHSVFDPPRAAMLFFRPVAALAAAAALAILINSPGPFGALVLVMAGGLPATAFLFCLSAVQDSRRAHQPYRALPILRRFRFRRARMSPRITLYLLLALIALCSYPVLRFGSLVSGPAPDTIRMQPIGKDKQGLSWSALTALSEYSASSGIPDLADYLTHRAFQESLMFGRSYDFPIMGERILVSDYRLSAGNTRVHKTFRVVKQFKESWLHETLSVAEPGSVARLFADQGFAGTVELVAASGPVGRSLFSGVLVVLFLLQFLVPRYLNLTASVLYATRSLTLRRH